jgi:hypothetical protein
MTTPKISLPQTSWSAAAYDKYDENEAEPGRAEAASKAGVELAKSTQKKKSKKAVTKIDFLLFEPDYDAHGVPRNDAISRLKQAVTARQWRKRDTAANLHALLGLYQRWGESLRPAVSFDDFLARTHKLGSTAPVRDLLAAEREGRIQFRSQTIGGGAGKAKSISTDEHAEADDDDDDDDEFRLFDNPPNAEDLFDSLFGPTTAAPTSTSRTRGPAMIDERSPPPPPPSQPSQPLTDEQRARIEENRLKALERKRQLTQQSQASQASQDTTTATPSPKKSRPDSDAPHADIID